MSAHKKGCHVAGAFEELAGSEDSSLLVARLEDGSCNVMCCTRDTKSGRKTYLFANMPNMAVTLLFVEGKLSPEELDEEYGITFAECTLDEAKRMLCQCKKNKTK